MDEDQTHIVISARSKGKKEMTNLNSTLQAPLKGKKRLPPINPPNLEETQYMDSNLNNSKAMLNQGVMFGPDSGINEEVVSKRQRRGNNEQLISDSSIRLPHLDNLYAGHSNPSESQFGRADSESEDEESERQSHFNGSPNQSGKPMEEEKEEEFDDESLRTLLNNTFNLLYATKDTHFDVEEILNSVHSNRHTLFPFLSLPGKLNFKTFPTLDMGDKPDNF